MQRYRVDLCPLCKRKGGTLEAMVPLQSDSSDIVWSDEFLEVEDERSKAFVCRLGNYLEVLQTTFNVVELFLRRNGAISLTQTKKNENFVTPAKEDRFRGQRALVEYIGLNCRPCNCATVQLSAPGEAKVKET